MCALNNVSSLHLKGLIEMQVNELYYSNVVDVIIYVGECMIMVDAYIPVVIVGI